MDRAPTKWWRYIDDIFAIWPQGEEHLITFLDGINNFHPSKKFTAEWSYTSVTFLNTKVTVDDKGRLVTDLYVKRTNTHQYLHRWAAFLAIASVALLIARPLGCTESVAGQKIT